MLAYGVAIVNPPQWLSGLFAAEEWGTPPWEIMPGYATKHFWLRVRNFVKREEARAIKDKSK